MIYTVMTIGTSHSMPMSMIMSTKTKTGDLALPVALDASHPHAAGVHAPTGLTNLNLILDNNVLCKL